MFVHMFYTFCKAIILTMLLIFAFSFAFYMAFYDPADNFLVGCEYTYSPLLLRFIWNFKCG